MATATGIVGEFQDLKADVEAELLAMQCGDFYEFFGDDAETVARELDLNISQKSSGGTAYPMAGVPVDDLAPYLRGLVERGYRVAVADQYETDDGHAREITRIATPGTLIETTDESATFLAAIVRVEATCVGLALADITTGRFLVTRTTGDDALAAAIDTCHGFDPVEILPGPTIRTTTDAMERIREHLDAEIADFDREAFAPGAARRAVRDQFGRETIASLGLDDDRLAEVRAAGAIVGYVAETGVGVLPAMTRLTPFDDGRYVSLDVTTQRTLELTAPMIDGGTSLLETVDATVTAAGGRRLREWLTRPLQVRTAIERRLESVDALVKAPLARDRIRDHLAGMGDLARATNRSTRGSADARTLVRIGRTLQGIPQVREAIADDPRLTNAPIATLFADLELEILRDLGEVLTTALREDPPRTVQEGGLFQRGYDADLDDVIEAHESALGWIDELGERERSELGITHLQVDRNSTDGYYIQVGNSETAHVPDRYREIKTLKHSKRYATDELEAKEREIVRLETTRAEREYELFQELRAHVAEEAASLQEAARAIAKLDTLASLATHASEQGWVRPSMQSEGEPIDITGGRHPVVETTTEFVPNDTTLTDDRRVVLVTGPNMSGKSTYLRQNALIVLLAQIGSFVPAEAADIGLIDGIYTRVGALDELSQGRSTFMVEMQELANILHSAGPASLVILDEVGRGTATYDGISIAWAATEYLHNETGARTLFATHYHELTELAARLPAADNAHVAAEEDDGDVTFLRTVRPGRADRSYGIHVASLAGVPTPVRERARGVLRDLREDRRIEARGADTTIQAVFDFDAGNVRRENAQNGGGHELPTEIRELLDEVRNLPVEDTAPIEVAQRVAAWQERLQEE